MEDKLYSWDDVLKRQCYSGVTTIEQWDESLELTKSLLFDDINLSTYT